MFPRERRPRPRTRSRTTVKERPAPVADTDHTPQPLRSASGERLMHLSRSEDAARGSEHMRLAEPRTSSSRPTTEAEVAAPRSGNFSAGRTQQELHTYVRQMEETIAQLVQQKDELLRNQAEFDKQASGIFPSLENLNHQLSQIVQGKLLNSGQSQNNDDVVNLHEDMLDERRKMRDERSELLADSIKKLQQELQEAVKNMVQRYQLLDKRINQLQTPMTQPRLVGRKSQRNTLLFIIAMLGIISVTLGFLIKSSGDCGIMERCHPLI
ncbi:Transcription-associated protein [Phytophthora cinnamomi]|uniref:Transcription-associated protein n=1 Tax=Phytophthora cinnamomi TaxID=4785 RepID=UPI003559E8DB|nr:Transcription-associated protein [Phytophthora cinnamomi]